MRDSSIVKYISGGIAIMFGAFYFYTSGIGIFSTQSNLGLYILFTNVLCIFAYPAMKKYPNNKLLFAYDMVVILLIAVSTIYWLKEFPIYAAKRAGLPTFLDMVMAGILILMCLEVTRRVLGPVLFLLGLVMLAQIYYGPWMPGIFRHSGVSLRHLLTFTYFTDGIFGTVTSTFATFVMPFLIFGAFLQHSGGGSFFINLASALAGRISGGPALVAVAGSAIFGSISGSPIANVCATGPFTIPLMRRVGYKPEFAAAVEAAASTGGAFLPPIMGAAAFILATNTMTPYGEVITMAIIPGILYFVSVAFMVYFQARRSGLLGLPAEELPNAREVLKKGWYYIFTVVLVMAALMSGYSVPRTAFFACVFLVICSMFRKETRFTPKKFIQTLGDAAKSSLTVGATAGTMGIIMAGISMTGLGIKISQVILTATHGNLLITMLLVTVVSVIVGLGLTITAAYIILSILAAPALIQIGIQPAVAHFAIMWLSLTSNLTPPVCVAAITAAGIAKAKPMVTGLIACVLGFYIYILPFAMIYTPQILILGYPLADIIEITIRYLLIAVVSAAAVQGWIFRNLNIFVRLLFLTATVLLIMPDTTTSIAGLVLFIPVAVFCFIRSRKEKALQEAT